MNTTLTAQSLRIAMARVDFRDCHASVTLLTRWKANPGDRIALIYHLSTWVAWGVDVACCPHWLPVRCAVETASVKEDQNAVFFIR